MAQGGGGHGWAGAEEPPEELGLLMRVFPHFWPVKRHQDEHHHHCPRGPGWAAGMGRHMGWVLLHVRLPTPPRCPQQLLGAPFSVGAAPGLSNEDLSRV